MSLFVTRIEIGSFWQVDGPILEFTCSGCRKSSSDSPQLARNWVAVLGVVPLFPLNLVALARCHHCHASSSFEDSETVKSVVGVYNSYVSPHRNIGAFASWWLPAGLATVGAVAGFQLGYLAVARLWSSSPAMSFVSGIVVALIGLLVGCVAFLVLANRRGRG